MTKTTTLGKRLGTIAEEIVQTHHERRYNHIWDCCCDHGYLGIHLLNYFSAKNTAPVQVNFVDQVAHITEPLKKKLAQKSFSHYEVHTLNAEHLVFDSSQRHCIIVAGVTTNGMLKILDAILKQHPSQTLDFILCPTRGQYDLRQFLIHRHMHLLQEYYLNENKRHYELLFVRHSINTDTETYKPVPVIGEFWEKANQNHINYLANRISHYQQHAIHSHQPEALKYYSAMLHEIRQLHST